MKLDMYVPHEIRNKSFFHTQKVKNILDGENLARNDLPPKNILDDINIEMLQTPNKLMDFPNSSYNKTNEYIISSNETCVPNINMLKLYDSIPFDNIDGGAWKQGWNIDVNNDRWNENNRLRVFVVPHSHNDPGWKRTFEDYYRLETKNILNNMVIKLIEDYRRKFIWAEISYFSLWWKDINQDTKNKVKMLINNNQLEIVTGGWVMTDEANAHYTSMITELVNGHQWLKENLNITAKYSWCIDPFGVSPTMPYILKRMQLSGLVIQRTHYAIKKYLARNKKLEFQWRQHWDNECSNDNVMFTHMMPFYNYDIPHTCGPDPSICCQFDFKRLPGFGISCPWKLYPVPITQMNVKSKALLLLDQYKKKAELYKTNILLIPLGDDFRYTSSREWDFQMNNYQKIFDYLNKYSNTLHVEASFGTLKDYFEAVKSSSNINNFPSLVGDFFTYADKDKDYWSGYFTSRPFYKSMDRELVSTLRATEILYSLVWLSTPSDMTEWLWQPRFKLYNNLQMARDAHSLFQHHDGITGTAKDSVVNDYAKKMLDALDNLHHIIQHCLYFLLHPEKDKYNFDFDQVYFKADSSRVNTYSLSQPHLILFENNIYTKNIVVFNSLTYFREEIITLTTNSDNVKILDSDGKIIAYQLDITCQLQYPELNTLSCFQIHFSVVLEPLEIKKFTIISMPADIKTEKYKSVINVYNFDNMTKLHHDINVKNEKFQKIYIENEQLVVAFDSHGLLKDITLKSSGNSYPVSLKFVRYDVANGPDMSGAYLFIPSREAEDAHITEKPKISVIKGKILSQVIVQYSNVRHAVVLKNLKGIKYIEIKNLVDIRHQMNYELAMRVTSEIDNNNIFYTDLNGFQIIKRKYFEKLPIQGNFYPMSSAMYIEDNIARISLLSTQPLGASSLKSGQMEVIQDRRLSHDDNRGLGQGVLDNVPTQTLFRLLIEERINDCKIENPYLTEDGMISMSSLLYPPIWFSGINHQLKNNYNIFSYLFPSNLHLVSLTLLVQELKPTSGLILHRVQNTKCFGSKNTKNHSNEIYLKSIQALSPEINIFESSLSFVHVGSKIDVQKPQYIKPMELKGYLLIK
ncbi:alpha-mannosidase 2 isoform X2 [Daktulosphaira vitifoliae]|uniref:alpha-mannosidase 2 isoform X2 n=1 Tax=Daktulosphaira vitifoliae TaxID=58002 RepID=UPI0021AAB9CD|nr:alpha-mannosidase 2 isoform X2 [Daktulosphaira vitifoliae]